MAKMTQVVGAVCPTCRHLVDAVPHECVGGRYPDIRDALIRGAIEAEECAARAGYTEEWEKELWLSGNSG
jgi:hypothetical protein